MNRPLGAIACGFLCTLALSCVSGKSEIPLNTGAALPCEPPSSGSVNWEFAFAIAPTDPNWLDKSDVRFNPVRVPGYWHEQSTFPNTGFGVYRLSIPCRLNPDYDSLSIGELSSAGSVYWNGKLIATIGLPGETASAEFGRIAPARIRLPDGPGELRIFVSNFHARGGGILQVSLGNFESLSVARSVLIFREASVIGFILACGIFFFIYYLARRDMANLLFFLLMLSSSIRSISSNSFLEEFAPERDWTQLRLLVEYLTAISFMPPLYFGTLYFLLRNPNVPSARDRLAGVFAAIYAPAGILLSLFFTASGDASIYGLYQPLYVMFYLVPGLAMCLLYLILSAISRAAGARSALWGFGAILFTTLLDSENTVGGNSRDLLVPAGLVIFAICYSTIVGRRIYNERIEVNHLRQGMEVAGKKIRYAESKLEKRFAQKSERIQHLLKQIEHRTGQLLQSGKLSQEDGYPIISSTGRMIRLLNRMETQELRELDLSAYLSQKQIVLKTSGNDRLTIEATDDGVVLANRSHLDRFIAECVALGSVSAQFQNRTLTASIDANKIEETDQELLVSLLTGAGARVATKQGDRMILSGLFAATPKSDVAILNLNDRHGQFLSDLKRSD